jgi:hypothetical protein
MTAPKTLFEKLWERHLVRPQTDATRNRATAPTATPAKTIDASLPPRSPAISTSAHAAPSGYGSTPCSLTMSARRSGTIINTPMMPPANASMRIWK